jgi:hypothetical protein
MGITLAELRRHPAVVVDGQILRRERVEKGASWPN